MNSLDEVKIDVKKKFTLDDSVKDLDLKSMEIEAKSIAIEGDKASLLCDNLILNTDTVACKKKWEHRVKSLEVAYGDFLENLVNDNLRKLIIRYDFTYDYYSDISMDFLIPDFLADYTNLVSLVLEHYKGSKKEITFESNSSLSIKKLHLQDLRLVLHEKIPTPNLETLVLDEVILDEKAKKYLLLPSIKKISYSEYEGTFNLDTSKLNNLYELDIYLDEVEDKKYPIKKLTINHSRIENLKPKNFPNVEIFDQKYIESEDFSGLIGFKKLKRLETMVSKYTNSNLTDIEKLEGLEEFRLYYEYIPYGKHQTFSLPLFKKPLKIKKLELEKLNVTIEDTQHEYFSELEELVLDDTLISDYTIFKIDSLKRVRVMSNPSVNCPENWLEVLKESFSGLEIIV